MYMTIHNPGKLQYKVKLGEPEKLKVNIRESNMEEKKDSISEIIATLILLPLVLAYKVIVVAIIFGFLASPLILLGWAVYMIAR